MSVTAANGTMTGRSVAPTTKAAMNAGTVMSRRTIRVARSEARSASMPYSACACRLAAPTFERGEVPHACDAGHCGEVVFAADEQRYPAREEAAQV
jgi:hypothetical protein